jgi:hypothetical protein
MNAGIALHRRRYGRGRSGSVSTRPPEDTRLNEHAIRDLHPIDPVPKGPDRPEQMVVRARDGLTCGFLVGLT